MAGTLRRLEEARLTVGLEAAAEVLRIDLTRLAPDEVLYWHWQGPEGEGRDLYAPRPWKSYDLQPPSLTTTAAAAGGGRGALAPPGQAPAAFVAIEAAVPGRVALTLSAQALAAFVAIEADVPGRFSDNAFALIPGHPAQVIFTPDDAAAKPRFTFRDLYSATYGPHLPTGKERT